MTPDELSALASGGEIDTVIVGFTDPYGRLMGKRFDAEFFVETGWEHGTHACDYLFTVDMEMEPVPGYDFANWDGGYGDVHLVPDPSTLRRAGWTERTALVLCDVARQLDDAVEHEREQLVEVAFVGQPPDPADQLSQAHHLRVGDCRRDLAAALPHPGA